MKTITKLFTVSLLAVSTLAATKSHSQSMSNDHLITSPKFKIGVGVSGGLTNSDSPFSYGLGADVKLQLDLQQYVSITASAGYTRLMEQDDSAVASYDFIPVVGGIRVYPSRGFYVGGIIGAGLAIQDGSKTSLIFGGGLGYEWTSGLELGVHFEGYQQDVASTTYQKVNGQYALRLGYNF